MYTLRPMSVLQFTCKLGLAKSFQVLQELQIIPSVFENLLSFKIRFWSHQSYKFNIPTKEGNMGWSSSFNTSE